MTRRFHWNKARPGYGGADIALGQEWRRSFRSGEQVIIETDSQAAARLEAKLRKKTSDASIKKPNPTPLPNWKRDPEGFRMAREKYVVGNRGRLYLPRSKPRKKK
jgi:hypothetical protein